MPAEDFLCEAVGSSGRVGQRLVEQQDRSLVERLNGRKWSIQSAAGDGFAANTEGETCVDVQQQQQ